MAAALGGPFDAYFAGPLRWNLADVRRKTGIGVRLPASAPPESVNDAPP
jgi:hypothetical protein